MRFNKIMHSIKAVLFSNSNSIELSIRQALQLKEIFVRIYPYIGECFDTYLTILTNYSWKYLELGLMCKVSYKTQGNNYEI